MRLYSRFLSARSSAAARSTPHTGIRGGIRGGISGGTRDGIQAAIRAAIRHARRALVPGALLAAPLAAPLTTPLVAQQPSVPPAAGERIHAPARTRWASAGQTSALAQMAALESLAMQWGALRAQAEQAAASGAVPALRSPVLLPGRTAPLAGMLVQAAVSVGFPSETPALTPAALSQALYGPGSHAQTSVTGFYRQASDSLFTIVGQVAAQVQLPYPVARYVGQRSASRYGGVGDSLDVFLRAVFARADSAIDFASYADPLDAQHRVAALVILVAGQGGECLGDVAHFWSHRWSATDVLGAPYQTRDRTAQGQTIVIDDYILQPVNACGSPNFGGAGVVVHESGHLIGLPDLYDTSDPQSRGPVGNWDVMATGLYNTLATPAQLGAWSRTALGWLALDSLAVPSGGRAVHLTAPPVHQSRLVTLLPFGTTDEFLLAENRRRAGTDTALAGEGLVLWYVNPSQVTALLPTNRLNTSAAKPAVSVLQADGRLDLEVGSNRGDGGDVWPLGTTQTLDTGTTPALRSRVGTAIPGFALRAIEHNGTVIEFDVVGRGADPNALHVLPDTIAPVGAGRSSATTFRVTETLTTGTVTFSGDTAGMRVLGGRWDAGAQTLTLEPTLRATDTVVALTVRATYRVNGTALREGARTYLVRVTGTPMGTALTVLPATLNAIPSGRAFSASLSTAQDDSLKALGYTTAWSGSPTAMAFLGATLAPQASGGALLAGDAPGRTADTTFTLTITATAAPPASSASALFRLGQRTYTITLYGTRTDSFAALLDAVLDPTGAPLPAATTAAYDRLGNRNGRFDLGDLVMAIRLGVISPTGADRAAAAAAGLGPAIFSTGHP